MKRTFRKAGIAAHAMPPSAPASSIAGSTSGLPLAPKFSATTPLAIAPRISCPSAPMFHTPARKPIATPVAHSMIGAAFEQSSPRP